MKISESLKRFRAGLNLSQKDVANKLGMLPQSYYRYESGKSIPPADAIITLANVYNVSADYLLGLSDAPRSSTVNKEWINRLTVSRDLIQSILRDTGQVPAQ
ncbi:MAG: helix-turn-helix transcriptional regulator [Selenomonadaceae bacterium]|nr:helix-turn-helix transcriptional regulator [Selenomonadaceae bacterium]